MTTKNNNTNITLNVPVKFYEKQHKAFWNPCRYSFIEGSTKSGKSVAAIFWVINKLAQTKPHQNIWMVAPVYSQAKILFTRMVRYLPKELITVNKGEMTIILKGAGTVYFKSADNTDSLYGEDVVAAVIDEASRTKEGTYEAIRSTTTSTQGQIRCIGNVRGRANWFYRKCREAEQGKKDYFYQKLTAVDADEAGVLPEGELEAARADLSEAVFNELYMCRPCDDGFNPFGAAYIKQCLAPMSTRKACVYGVDIAGTLGEKNDSTVIIGLDEFGAVCHFEKFKAEIPEVEERILEVTKGTPTLIDATGLGLGVYQKCARHSLKYEPFKFTNTNKQQLMEVLAAAIKGQDVSFPDNEIKFELDNFEYTYKGMRMFFSAPAGMHDDCVCGLALAYKIYTENRPRVNSKEAKQFFVQPLSRNTNRF